MNEKKQLLEGEIPRHTNNSNQDIPQLLRPQQKAPVLYASGLDVIIRDSQDISA